MSAMPALVGRNLRKTFRRDNGERVLALNGVSLEADHGTLTALVGPDGSGKTTLLRLAVGLMTADAGELKVLGLDVAAHPQQVQERIGYMPQKFGLYEDLSVRENLDLYADMHGVTGEQRRQRYPRLLEMTALGPFTNRLAGRLSGGMKQKLGLACTLVRSPELLLLDEPTVGVDPLSRRELWDIIRQLVHDQGLSVLMSTSYLDEAERCEHVVVLHQGQVLAQGCPGEVSELAANRTFLATPPPGQTARGLQRAWRTTQTWWMQFPKAAKYVWCGPSQQMRTLSQVWPLSRRRPGLKTASWCSCGDWPQSRSPAVRWRSASCPLSQLSPFRREKVV